MSDFLNLPSAGTGDLHPGAMLVLQDRRMVTILDVVRYSSIEAVERSLRSGVSMHSPLLGPIQFVAVIDEATGQRAPLSLTDLAGARLLRRASRAA